MKAPPPTDYLRFPGHTAVTRWLLALNNRLPLVGGAVRRGVAAQLAKLALVGSPAAAWMLAWCADQHFDPQVRALSAQAVAALQPPQTLKAAWLAWSHTRGRNLSQVLLHKSPPHGAPTNVQALALLFLQKMDALQSAGAEMVQALVAYTADPDPVLAARARFAIAHLTAPPGISALCQLWAESRSPGLLDAIIQAGYQPDTPVPAAVLVALKTNRLDRVTFGSEGILPALIAAGQDDDAEINARARFCLLNLQKLETVDAFCAAWAAGRAPLLEATLLQAGYLPRQPARVRLLAALKIDRADLTAAISSDALPALLEALHDPDPQIAARAAAAARRLEDPDARDRLCQMVIEDDSAEARAIALEAGYLPTGSPQRAAFLFLTNQMDAYEVLDYDRRLLNAVYETAGPALRQRIMRRIRQSGRQDFLTILAGADYRSRAAEMTPIESQLIVSMLAANRDWERLWLLARELSLEFAVDILRTLSQNNWQPADESEQPIFAGLVELAGRPLSLSGKDLENVLPPAVPRASLRLHGRVNDLAFAPSGTLLAIGASSRRLALWDYQRATLVQTFKGFDHSIGNVTYSSSGLLCCAERSNNTAACALYAVPPSGPVRVGQHARSITALEPCRNGLLLAASRDGTAALWDAAACRKFQAVQLEDWARAACVSASGDRAALLERGYALLTLPDLAPLPARAYRWADHTYANPGVIRCAAFLPNSPDLLAGQFNGHVVLYQDEPRPTARAVTRFPGPVEAVRPIPGHDLTAVAGASGEVRFFASSTLKVVSSVQQPAGGRLTSLHISPDGAFMATGASDSTMTLWDLRVLDIPELFSRPLAAARPGQIPAVQALSEYQALPDPLRNALIILASLLQLRFRYDIQLSEIPTIQVGEFDVMIDE